MRQNFRVIAAFGVAAVALSAAEAFAAVPQLLVPQPVTGKQQAWPQAQPSTSTLIVRDQPSLLTPPDLRFSVETQNGVVVIRGPRAR